MKKKIFIRALVGAPIGVFISYMITIMISLAVGNGTYYPAAFELTASCENEINAVIIQLVGSLVFGAICGGASVIWEIEEWGLMKMTLVHLAVFCIPTFPIALLLRWIPIYTVAGTILYFVIFFGIYLMIWLFRYFPMRAKVRKMNERIKELRDNKD